MREGRLPEIVWAAVIALAAWTTGSPTFAASIEGRVLYSVPEQRPIEPNPYPGRVGAKVGVSAPAQSVENVIVFLDRVESPFQVPLPPNATMAQRGQEFVPRVVPIVVGQSVSFPNEDPIYHNVFSYTPCCRFDLGRYPRGKSKDVRFDQLGVVRIFCEIHSDMAGWVLVLQNPHFVRAQSDGRYRLSDVSPGNYRLVAWHPEMGRKEWPIEVAESTITLDLVF